MGLQLGDKYICSMCKGEFRTAWTEEESLAEFEDNFPTDTVANSDIVCDDCYKKVMGHISQLRH